MACNCTHHLCQTSVGNPENSMACNLCQTSVGNSEKVQKYDR